ncbi:hypothetical protein SDC9_159264 [bioreactor metagenome]|uniref:Uncharacterized protein n=1 Tax=bioreactor metagenome TaxID=1076179 RepID=A0A645FC56_9ZZZZ
MIVVIAKPFKDPKPITTRGDRAIIFVEAAPKMIAKAFPILDLKTFVGGSLPS